MSIHSNYPIRPDYYVVKITLTVLLFSSYFIPEVFGSSSRNAVSQDKFVITGSEFCRRSRLDAGEIRIFLKNTGKGTMSISQCKLSRLPADKDEGLNSTGREINYLYSKLSPPVLMPDQNGELLIKLLKAPLNDSELKCTVYDGRGRISETSISIEQAPVWVPYVGFSEDLGKVYVYVQNNTQTSLKVQLLNVAGINAGDNYQSINNNLSPNDKGCLVFKMPTPLTFGEYVHVTVSAEWGDQQWQTHRIVRAVNKFPLQFRYGHGEPELGLDYESFFTEIMRCPAHAHGTHENAVRKFLDKHYTIFLQNPYFLTSMKICRSGKPQAWYKFGPLPDIAVMNPILLAPPAYESDAETFGWFHPFFWLSTAAKKAAAPNRYFANIPTHPEDTVFLQSRHTPDEIKFLVYCAIASGAKGILYRRKPSSDQLSRDGFIRLNKELQHLKPLLMVAEPVNWASTADGNYYAKSLLGGDEAILVMVFDRQYFGEQKNNRVYTAAFEKTIKPVKIEVKVPEGFLVSEVKSMYSTLPKKFWSCREGQLHFTADMVDSVHVYKVILTRIKFVSSLKEIAQPCKNKDTH